MYNLLPNVMLPLFFSFFISNCLEYFQVAKYKDPRDACAAIVAESYRLWLQYETRTDDITVIVVHIDGLVGVSEQAFCKRCISCLCIIICFSLVFPNRLMVNQLNLLLFYGLLFLKC